MSVYPLRFDRSHYTEEQIQAIVSRAQAGSSRAWDQLCHYILAKAEKHVHLNQWVTPATPAEDLIQQSLFYLRKFLEKYDPTKGKSVWGYAQKWVDKAIYEYFDSVRVGDQIPLSLDCPDEDGNTIQIAMEEEPETRPSRAAQQQQTAINRAIQGLEAWEQELFTLHYADNWNKTDIAKTKKFGSRTTVYRKLKAVKAKLDHKVERALKVIKEAPFQQIKKRIIEQLTGLTLTPVAETTTQQQVQPQIIESDHRPQARISAPEHSHRRGNQCPHNPGEKPVSIPRLLRWPLRDPIPDKHRWHGLGILFAVALLGCLLWQDLALAQPQLSGAANNFNGSCTAGVFSGIRALVQGAIGLFDAQAGADSCGMVQAILPVVFLLILGVILAGVFRQSASSKEHRP